MPKWEQRRILTSLARHLLMEATALGDVRVATYILLQERMGRDPARTLADGVIAAVKAEPRPAAAPSPRTPSTSPGPARPSDDPDLRAMRHVESRLQAELAHEHAAVADEAPAEEFDTTADAAPAAADAAPDQPDPPAERGWRTRRRPRPHGPALPSYEQARALEAMILLKKAAPDDPPTPRAQAP